MLSILIPTYNLDPSELVQNLIVQLNERRIEFEIIIRDDNPGSNVSPMMEQLIHQARVSYIVNQNTLGRAKNRNALAADAVFPYLLFVDGDAKLNRIDFIEKYHNELDAETIVCGGTEYQANRPSDNLKILRWKFGCKREAIHVDKRNKRPHSQFSTFNFLVPKAVMLEIPFNDKIEGYGHEDSLWGYQLAIAGYRIKHIDNPLEHTGLDPSFVFLKKITESLRTLTSLSENDDIDKEFMDSIKVWKAYSSLKKFHLLSIFNFTYSIVKKFILNNLNSTSPSLKLLDLYKLGTLSQIQV